jgi:hypothetical protein
VWDTPRLVLAASGVLALALLLAPSSPRAVGAQEGESPTPAPTRTRRPTRTPGATAVPTGTPLPAGALRLTLAMEPPEPRVGEEASLVVDLLGLDDVPLVELVLDVDLPVSLARAEVLSSSGETARAGSMLRWRLPALPPGGGAGLRLTGVPELASNDEIACVLLVSRAATMEQCLAFRVRPPAAPSEAEGALSRGVPGAPPGEDLPVAPVGSGWSDVLQQPQALVGWGLLLAGLAVLGGWLGASMGGAPDSGEAQPPRPKAKKTS